MRRALACAILLAACGPSTGVRDTGLDGLRVVEVTLAMIESARTHRSVKIERVEP